MTSKGKSKKNPVKEIAKPLPNEAEIKENSKEQNATIQKDNPETKNVKNTKKGNTRKAAPRGKPDAAAGKTNDAQTEEAATSEMDVKENGEAHTEAEPKQKKRNAGKANVEAKGKQKKEQVAAASVDEEEATKDVTAESETTETNVASEIDGNDTKDVPLDSKDDSILLIEPKYEKIEINDSIADSVKDEVTPIADPSSNEVERSGSFLCM